MLFQWGMRRQKKQMNDGVQQEGDDHSGEVADVPQEPMSAELAVNIDIIRRATGESDDVVIRRFSLGQEKQMKAAVVFVDGLVDEKNVYEFLLTPLLTASFPLALEEKERLQWIEQKLAAVGGVKHVADWKLLFCELFSGATVMMIDGTSFAICASTKGGQYRSIEEPQTQIAVRGPREGFTESLRTNTAMIRRRIKNPNLWLETMQIGTVTQTDVAIMYVKGIANDEIIEEVKKRLRRIDIDGVLESGYIEQLIEDQTFTPFPTTYHTERPDIVAANLLEGRVAIFVEGTPFVLVAPALFIQFFQAVEDYYARFDIATALRFLRVLIFFISLVAPAAYIAGTMFHQEMIPTLLVIAIAAQREAVPFPAFVEALIMEVTFEILREAGIRLPRAVGQAVSIVGALVIGQAAVEAGLVSSAMVIVVSITAIASFATPSFAIAISARLIRFALMFLAAMFGFYGIMMGLLVMTIHLCSLRSFGVPYMSPLAPFMPSNMGDTLFRLPTWMFRERPRLISQKNIVRQSGDQKPQQPTPSRQGKGDES
ncbi:MULTISPECIES: spore germination protein [Geobacillus]|jgi:spore germination protein KA|uniref:Spore germination protein GerKA n=1 Tax=Geobacillus thermodenitrificans (strain NG80-2) TaxID=420246 RepID=A4IND7_GEOTN|nr:MULTISPECIES: spore germination protein [Geobacillus]ABO66841.1 Spore germination protein GerKA [Geobacillus thermodenitrificans NG80-2]ARA96812.1 spore germination protein [Geobacillus thermodenitrificans]ARP42607.1 putative membrane protein YfkQ [Geobacillus thermodenitrificans]NNU86399.1 spore germination protein [Geobacillus sp. MR]PJW20628.1 spore germination protein [Geobacillus thermodenitrificans]